MGLIRIERLPDADGPVHEVTMCDTGRRNALGPDLLEGLDAALRSAASDGCRAMILRAEPGVTTWSAGYDIEHLPAPDDDPLGWVNPLDGLLDAVRTAPFPVIAAVEGGAWGGACELALTCDLLVAIRSATFGITPARLGVPYATSGVRLFLAALPPALAKEMFFTADPVDAAVLASHGAVNRVVEDTAGLTVAARTLALRIAERAPLTVRAVKAEMTALAQSPVIADEQAAGLADLRRAAWSSEDYREGIRAFREKRPPRFTGG